MVRVHEITARCTVQLAVVGLLFVPSLAAAQNPEIAGLRAESDQTLARAQSQDPEPQKPEPPPAAVGEAGTKETHSFFPALAHNLLDDVKHLPRWNTVVAIGIGGGLAAIVHPWDAEINNHLVGTPSAFWKAGAFIGQTPTILAASLTTYAVGRATSSPRAAHLGMDEIEASLLTGAITLGLKQAVKRPRPLALDGSEQSGYSFPSGHSSATFAAATVLQQHLGYKAGIPTYLVASYVAMSRLHDNKHYASDVLMGAGIGVAVGRTVTWHGRHFYGWTPDIVPVNGGLMVSLRKQGDLRTSGF
jgi:membrane-associated phospholipid phosphatase